MARYFPPMKKWITTLILTSNAGPGDIFWVSILMIPEFNAGVCTKSYGTLHDIDERVRSSMKIDELFKKTEKQNNRLMNFAHTITHNLRSQVGGVNSFIEIMEIAVVWVIGFVMDVDWCDSPCLWGLSWTQLAGVVVTFSRLFSLLWRNLIVVFRVVISRVFRCRCH